MTQCTTCGAAADESQKFCDQCGANLDVVEDGGSASTAETHEITRTSTDDQTEAAHNSSSSNTTQVRVVENVDVYLGSQQKIALTGVVLTIIGAFLPWASVFGQRVHGIDGDGSLTFIAALIAGGIVALRPWTRFVRNASIVLGAVIAFIALYDMTGVAASGIYLTLLGGLALLYPGVKEILQL